MKTFLLAGVVSAFVSANAAESDSLRVDSDQCSDGAKIESIEFEGLEHTKPRVVWRELTHKVGGEFSQKTFESEKLRLQDLDLFTDIYVSCKGGNVVYNFKEIFRWIPSPDSKTTDRDGLMLGLALANLNVLGEDIRAEVHYRTAIDPFFENNEYAFYASSPYLFGIPLGWNIDFTRTDSWDDLREFKDASWLLSLDLNWKFVPHYSLLGKLTYRYLEKGPGVLPEFGLGFAVDYRDSELDTRKGIYFESDVTHVGVGGKRGENFVEFLEDARAYYSVGRFVTGATALVRLRPGDVKRYDYFYHGGTNSFRGLNSPDADHLGVHEMLLNLEERFVLLERRSASLWGINFFYGIQLVAGFDASVLWDKGAPGWKNYEGAVYGGLHIVIPALDRIRLEIGYSPDTGKPKFSWGILGKTTTQRWRSR
ncbi:BamA/TamA family outer membrane protein [Fibrobacter sp. UWB7]|uniref:BamA/TamA family outer membrane protein n=1 Tax=Fibrobacter sp. UWB7 TaxID=1896206 RepID=UPI0009156BDD|nr:BamA/TamA family outer membrane protein [Fibrobacter sp. UWB7]SHL95756.1 Surface antigen variable number repeat-containing protein [Fibrobacter sp. UWB7]